MLIGYAQASPNDPRAAGQLKALVDAGCQTIFKETLKGARGARPELARMLTAARPGDVIVIARLDRLAGSLKELIETIEDIHGRFLGFRSLAERLDANVHAGRAMFDVFTALAGMERAIGRARETRAAASPRGAKPKLAAPDLDAARQLLASGEHTVAEVAARLGVSRPTLYRYIPRARAANR